MPTYEYECQVCEYPFERFQSIRAEPIKICPKCQGSVKRLFGMGAGIIFKGSGFYQTDYRSSSYQKKAEADKGPSSSNSTSSSSGQSSSAPNPKPNPENKK
ncbi:MAG: zinc ribbon domain-containing protein [Candidatus Omnitrophica bacterium]|nr:zinc ribbon domain-containing protein [Candidatus Omnitrophota bacterium]